MWREYVFANSISINDDARGMERCGICKKLIYMHQPTVVCCLDGHIYHGTCLGYDIDTCSHIRNILKIYENKVLRKQMKCNTRTLFY